mgnify:CR=1 FL=1
MAIGFLSGFSQGYQGEKDRQTKSRLADSLARRDTRDMENWYKAPEGVAPPPPGGEASYTYDGKISDRVGHAFSRFRAAGLPDHISAGLVGNLMQEAGEEINPAAVGDNGNAFGAGQWNGPRRRDYLYNFVYKGVEPTDFDTQIDYLLHEGQTTEKGAWGAIMQAKTPDEAARIASERFWRPGTPHVERRMGYARAVYANRPANESALPARQIKAQEPSDWAWFRKYGGGV